MDCDGCLWAGNCLYDSSDSGDHCCHMTLLGDDTHEVIERGREEFHEEWQALIRELNRPGDIRIKDVMKGCEQYFKAAGLPEIYLQDT